VCRRGHGFRTNPAVVAVGIEERCSLEAHAAEGKQGQVECRYPIGPCASVSYRIRRL
jgi:hypothetical protein